MFFNVFLISVVLLVIAGIGFGIKLLFDKNAEMPAGSCRLDNDKVNEFSCGCGKGMCEMGDVKN